MTQPQQPVSATPVYLDVSELTAEGTALHTLTSLGEGTSIILQELIQVTRALATTVPDGNHYFSQIPDIEINLDKALNPAADIISKVYAANRVMDFLSLVQGLEQTLDGFKVAEGNEQAKAAASAWTDTLPTRNYVMEMAEDQSKEFKELFQGRGVLLRPVVESDATKATFVLARHAANAFRVHQSGHLSDEELKAIPLPRTFDGINLPEGYELV